jgi:hypothetical protein
MTDEKEMVFGLTELSYGIDPCPLTAEFETKAPHRICGEDGDRRWSLIHGTCISAQLRRTFSVFCLL